MWGIFFLGFSPPCFVRSGIPYVPPLATRPRKPPSGFLVAPAGSRQLKTIKREEHQCIGQGNKWLLTPVTRPGWGGRGKENISHQFLPAVRERNEKKCLILLHPHLQAMLSLVWHHDSLPHHKRTRPEIWANVRATSVEHMDSPPLYALERFLE